MRAFLLFAVLALALAACSPERPIALRVRDPWLVAIDRIDPKGRAVRVLPPRVPQRDDCPWRDERGFPHFCSWGAYGTRDDGTIHVVGARRDDGEDVRVRFELGHIRTCRRAHHGPCWARTPMELVTPRANVTWIGLHEPPGEPALGPEVGLEHALYR